MKHYTRFGAVALIEKYNIKKVEILPSPLFYG
jgi:hypothetical protein